MFLFENQECINITEQEDLLITQVAINDDNEFFHFFKNMYPKEFELKVKHKGTQASFLELDITIRDSVFIFKLFDKRDKFPFFIVRMSHLSMDSIFYGLFYSELLRIARCTIVFSNLTPKASELNNQTFLQGGNTRQLQNHVKKIF